VHRRQSRAQRQGVDANQVGHYKRVGRDIKRIRAAIKRLEGRRNILCSPDFECDGLEAERADRRLNLASLQHTHGTADIGQDRQRTKAGENLAQEFKPFASKIGRLV